jgi:hypothetical protein
MTKLIIPFRNFAKGCKVSKPAGVSLLCKMRNISVKPDSRAILRAELDKLLQTTLQNMMTDKMICNLDRQSHCPIWSGTFLRKKRERTRLVKLQNARKFAQPEIGNLVLGTNSWIKFNYGMNVQKLREGKKRSRGVTSSQQWIKLTVTRHVIFRSSAIFYCCTLSLTVRPLCGDIF